MDTPPAWYPGLIMLLEDDDTPLDRAQIRIAVKAAVDYVHTHRAEIQPLQLRLAAKEAELDELQAEMATMRQQWSNLVKVNANLRADHDALEQRIAADKTSQ